MPNQFYPEASLLFEQVEAAFSQLEAFADEADFVPAQIIDNLLVIRRELNDLSSSIEEALEEALSLSDE